jgi:hypothetical protein
MGKKKKKIMITEEQLNLIRSNFSELTYYQFISELKYFLRELLEHPVSSQISPFFKKRGFTKKKLVEYLIKMGLLIETKKIDTDFNPPTVKTSYDFVSSKLAKVQKIMWVKFFEDKVDFSEPKGEVKEQLTEFIKKKAYIEIVYESDIYGDPIKDKTYKVLPMAIFENKNGVSLKCRMVEDGFERGLKQLYIPIHNINECKEVDKKEYYKYPKSNVRNIILEQPKRIFKKYKGNKPREFILTTINENTIKLKFIEESGYENTKIILDHIECDIHPYYGVPTTDRYYDFQKKQDLVYEGISCNVRKRLNNLKLPTLYYLAPSEYEDKIIEYGIIPKIKNKPIYLSFEIDNVVKLPQNHKIVNNYTLYQIEPFFYCFFDDPNVNGSIYTFDKISPRHIHKVGNYKLEDKELFDEDLEYYHIDGNANEDEYKIGKEFAIPSEKLTIYQDKRLSRFGD